MSNKKRKFGISTTIDYTADIFSQVKLISEAGFEFMSIGGRLEHSGFLERDAFLLVLELAQKSGLWVESIHVPFGDQYDIAASEPNVREAAIAFVGKCLQLASEYGIPIVILHPHHYFSDSKEDCLKRAVESLDNLSSTRPDNVAVAIENLPGKECSWICSNLLEMFDGTDYGFCYDSSHENISGEPFHLLKNFLARMTACHLSDNQGLSDEHLVPGQGNINWPKMREYFDMAVQMENILFEVGTGKRLELPLAAVLKETLESAKRYFE